MDNYSIQKEALLKLLQDTESFRKLEQWTSSINIFDVLKISRTEIRHSNMLGWLLDPNERHGMGDSVLRGLITCTSKSMEFGDAMKFLTCDLYGFEVYREWEHIDLILVNKDKHLVVAIENKIGAQEHKSGKSDESQLSAYETKLNKKYPDYNIVKLFLTPYGEEPSIESWLTLTYSEILDILSTTFENNKKKLESEAKVLIENYINIIKHNVIMDEELEKICKEIYQKHKIALDLIYEHREDPILQFSDEAKSIIENSKSGCSLVDIDAKKSHITFRTNTLCNFFSTLEKSQYFYQLEFRSVEDDVKLSFSLVFHKQKRDTPDANVVETMKKYASENKAGIKRLEKNDWEWIKAFSVGTKRFNEFDSDQLEKWIKDCLSKISQKEQSLTRS